MPGSDLIFIVLPLVIPGALALGVALPFIADSRAGRSRPARGAVRKPSDARAPVQRPSASQPLERTSPGPPSQAAWSDAFTSLYGRLRAGWGGRAGMRLWQASAGSPLRASARLKDGHER